MESTLGSRVAGKRVEQRLTQRELAEVASLSPSYVSEIETDSVNPSVDVLNRIAKVLGASLDFLVRGEAQ